jgi:hypothetical protein
MTGTYYVFRRTGGHGVHIGVIKERDSAVAAARFAALAPDRIDMLDITPDWPAAEETMRRARGSIPTTRKE